MDSAVFSLGDLIRSTTVTTAELAAAQGSRLHVQVDPSLPESVIGDAQRLHHLIVDLWKAAAELVPHRETKLAIFASHLQRSEFALTLEVTASLPESSAHANLPEQSEPLARVRGAAEQLGGDLGMEPGRGLQVVFWSRIPLQLPEAATPDALQNLFAPEAEPTAGSVRILMAEDNSINQRVGKLILQRAGYPIDLVGDGNEAFEAHRESPYSLILMDCQMPTMDGFEATRLIRSISSRQPVIIAVTANALVGERERCLAAGMDDYLSKPFQPEQLIAIVQKWAIVAASRGFVV